MRSCPGNALDQGDRHGRRYLDDHHGVGVGDGRHDGVHVAAFGECPCRAGPHALAAEDAAGDVQAGVEGWRHVGLEAAPHEVDGADALHRMTHGHAAAAEHTLVGVARDRLRRDVHPVPFGDTGVAVLAHAHVGRQGRQLAVAAAHAGQAVLRVARHQQLHDGPPVLEQPCGVRAHLHAVSRLQRAAGLQTRRALHLDHAQAAGGCRRGRPLQRAQVRYLDAGAFGDGQYGLAFGELDLSSVDRDAHSSTSQAIATTACLGQASTQAPQPTQRSTRM